MEFLTEAQSFRAGSDSEFSDKQRLVMFEMKHLGLSFVLINWIWLQIFDTPNRWFPTKYDHSFGSLGTLMA